MTSEKDLPEPWRRLTQEQREALLNWFREAIQPVAVAMHDFMAWFEGLVELVEKMMEEQR